MHTLKFTIRSNDDTDTHTWEYSTEYPEDDQPAVLAAGTFTTEEVALQSAVFIHTMIQSAISLGLADLTVNSGPDLQ